MSEFDGTDDKEERVAKLGSGASVGLELSFLWSLGIFVSYFLTQIFFLLLLGLENFSYASGLNALIYIVAVPLCFKESFGRLKGLRIFILSVVATLAVNFLWSFVLEFLGKAELQEVAKRISEIKGWDRLPVFISTALLIPCVEEVIFRLGFFKSLKKHFPVWGALLLSSVLFAVIHGEPLFFVPLTGLGFIFAYAYERTNCLWVAIALHSFNNALTLIDLWWDIL